MSGLAEMPASPPHPWLALIDFPSPPTRSKSGGDRGYGLASGGLPCSSSLNLTDGGASGATSGGTAAGCCSGQEVCSPPSKPLNFLALFDPYNPFVAASPAVTPLPPLDRRQQLAAASGGGAPAAAQHAAAVQQDSSDSEEGMGQEDRENQQPCGTAAAASQPPPATWLSPVAAPRPKAAACGAAASAPVAIPNPRAGLVSPGLAPMPTPAREAAEGGGRGLVHAPSFSSWMVPAARPPSPERRPAAGPAGRGVYIDDVVAGLTGDSRAARCFGTPGGSPTDLDCLLAGLQDSHYPASCESQPWSGVGVGGWLLRQGGSMRPAGAGRGR